MRSLCPASLCVLASADGPERSWALWGTESCAARKLCEADSDCSGHPYRTCRSGYGDCQFPVCAHKELWPALPLDGVLIGLLFLVAIAAGAAGIGGGGLNVPLLIVFGGFRIKEATKVSHAAVLGNALAQLVANIPQRHPGCTSRPLIHYELAFLLQPAMLGGNVLGVVFGRSAPPTLLVLLSTVLLIPAGIKTALKGRSEQLAALLAGQQRQESEAKSTDVVNISDAGVAGVAGVAGTTSGLVPFSFVGLVEPPKARRRIPWAVLGGLSAFTALTCVDQLLLSEDVSGVARCSALYWVSMFGIYPFVAAFLAYSVRALRDLQIWHRDRGEEQIPGDIAITPKLLFLMPTAAIFIGLFAGLLGLGGGEFVVPLLLEFGLAPRVASATSGFLIFFSVSTNITHYLFAGSLEHLGYATAAFLAALIGAFLGLFLRDWCASRHRGHVVIYVLAGLLFVSCGLLLYRGFVVDPIEWSFGPFCSD